MKNACSVISHCECQSNKLGVLCHAACEDNRDAKNNILYNPSQKHNMQALKHQKTLKHSTYSKFQNNF